MQFKVSGFLGAFVRFSWIFCSSHSFFMDLSRSVLFRHSKIKCSIVSGVLQVSQFPSLCRFMIFKYAFMLHLPSRSRVSDDFSFPVLVAEFHLTSDNWFDVSIMFSFGGCVPFSLPKIVSIRFDEFEGVSRWNWRLLNIINFFIGSSDGVCVCQFILYDTDVAWNPYDADSYVFHQLEWVAYFQDLGWWYGRMFSWHFSLIHLPLQGSHWRLKHSDSSLWSPNAERWQRLQPSKIWRGSAPGRTPAASAALRRISAAMRQCEVTDIFPPEHSTIICWRKCKCCVT